jgi:hypothetical protein
MTPFEGIRRGEGHVSPYQILIRFFATVQIGAIVVFFDEGGEQGVKCDFFRPAVGARSLGSRAPSFR